MATVAGTSLSLASARAQGLRSNRATFSSQLADNMYISLFMVNWVIYVAADKRCLSAAACPWLGLT